MKNNMDQVKEVMAITQKDLITILKDFCLYCTYAELDPETDESWNIYYTETLDFY